MKVSKLGRYNGPEYTGDVHIHIGVPASFFFFFSFSSLISMLNIFPRILLIILFPYFMYMCQCITSNMLNYVGRHLLMSSIYSNTMTLDVAPDTCFFDI